MEIKRGQTLLIILIIIFLIGIGGLITYLILKPNTPPQQSYINKCGDGTCGELENWQNCLKDCEKPFKPICGNNVCEDNEGGICLQDCPPESKCGDGICDAKEQIDPDLCSLDCDFECDDGDIEDYECDDGEEVKWCKCIDSEWSCTESPEDLCGDGPIAPFCGDGICDSDESYSSCSDDCPQPIVSRESHFGLGSEGATYSGTNNLITELGEQIYIRDGIRDNNGWRIVKGAQNQGTCISCCPDCSCEAGSMFYCDLSRDILTSEGLSIDLYNNDFNLLTTIGATQYGDIVPKFVTAVYPADEEEYKELVRKLVTDLSDKVKYWEIENEVDSPQFWRGTPTDYANLIKLASTEIKSICPDCKVGFGQSNPTPNDEWFTVINSICDYIDYMDIHYYEGMTLDILNSFDETGLDRWKSTCPGLEIISTETGIPSADVDFKLGEWELGGTEQKQAQDLIKYVTIMFNTGYDRVYLYLVNHDFIPDQPDDLWEHSGLLYENFEPKEAYETYKTMISKIDYFTSITKLTQGQYKYTFADKDPVYILWCDEEPCTLDNEVPTTDIRITDYQGNTQTDMTLTYSPIFVEEI